MPPSHIPRVPLSLCGITPAELNRVAPRLQSVEHDTKGGKGDNSSAGFSGIVETRGDSKMPTVHRWPGPGR